MKTKLRRLFTFAIVLFAVYTKAQDIGLKPGDPLPDIAISKIFNGPKTSGNTRDYKGKLLIIDFWATSCSGCVAALPKMEALQKQFGQKIMILPVSYEPENTVSTFWKKNKYTKNLTLPSVVEDKLFASYFKHLTIPHEVWVYKGKVIGVTVPEYVDAANIEKVLSGKQPVWPLKNDFYSFNGAETPLFKLNSGQVDTVNTFIRYAAISGYREGVNADGFSGGSGIVRDKKKKTVRVFFLNQPIFTSYILNWMKVVKPGQLVKSSFMVDSNQIVWEVTDRSRYQHQTGIGYRQDWIRKYGICFESVDPDTGQTDPEVYRSVIAKMDALLGLHVRWEKRKEKVLVLKLNAGSGLLKSGEKVSSDANEPEQNNQTPGNIVWQLNQYQHNPYVFDETKYTGNIDVNITAWTDIEAIRKALKPYGLELKEEERMVDKLVFTETAGAAGK